MILKSKVILELLHAGTGFAAMTRIAAAPQTRAGIRLLMAVLVAVVASMTMHHGAMARTVTSAHDVAATHHHSGQQCAGTCDSERHSMPVCCGMGLCLSGMPVAPNATLPAWQPAILEPNLYTIRPHWPVERIDRPPKDVLRDV